MLEKNAITIARGKSVRKWMRVALLLLSLFNPLNPKSRHQGNLETQHPACPRKCKSPKKELNCWRCDRNWPSGVSLPAKKRSHTFPMLNRGVWGIPGPMQGALVSNRERLGGGEPGTLSRDAAGGSRGKKKSVFLKTEPLL